nr:Spy/CpxP family protein refolding chaperone [uncultured Holophaga sp.]
MSTLLVTLPAGAQPTRGKRSEEGRPAPRTPGQHPFPLLDMARPLELSEKQVEAIKQKLEARAKTEEAAHKEGRKAMEAVMKAMEDPAVSNEQFRALAEKAAKLRTDEMVGDRVLLQDCLAVLTAEQKAKLAKLRSEGPGKCEQGRPGPDGPEGHGPHGGPGGPRMQPGMMPPPPPPCDMEGPEGEAPGQR